MRILGISAYYHDAAACLVEDGRIVAAAQEERFTRVRHDASFPANAARFCLERAGESPADLDFVVFYDKPFLKFERLLETYLAFAPAGRESFTASLPVWIQDKLFQKKTLADALTGLWDGVDWSKRLLFSEHHLSHAASAFFPSPFEEAAVLTMDGVGEWTTTSLALGKGNALSVQKEIRFPHSLGLLYSAFTQYTGFKVNSGEYKVMGLAPYGEPRFAALIKEKLIDIKDDGSFALDMSYFDYCVGLTMINERFESLFGAPARRPESLLTQREMDLAASVQAVTEEVVVKLARGIRKSTGQANLCLAGGVALNCVANGRVQREKIFDRLWIQPAAGDAGGAIGAALGAYHLALGGPRVVGKGDGMSGAYLGPEYDQAEVEKRLAAAGAAFKTLAEEDVVDVAARALVDGKAVGWHQGRMEFGPRALGARSILADPRSPDAQKRLNAKVKRRESFRPFAPSVPREDLAEWFALDEDSPYMMLVADVREAKRAAIPAVVHRDHSARLQTVHAETNSLYHRLHAKFKELTGCPVLVNTSFNVRGEPIVESPEDAFRCFMSTDLDLLVVGRCVLEKSAQDPALATPAAFEPD